VDVDVFVIWHLDGMGCPVVTSPVGHQWCACLASQLGPAGGERGGGAGGLG
jgi:hypothetical protein